MGRPFVRKHLFMTIAIAFFLYALHLFINVDINVNVRTIIPKLKVPQSSESLVEYSTAATTVENERQTELPHLSVANETKLGSCPGISPFLKGSTIIKLEGDADEKSNWPLTFEEIAVTYSMLELGGYYPGPRACNSDNVIAIVIPFRDREEHLKYLLYYLHGILQRQQARYRIFVVEQDNQDTFNKGQLMNTGYQYAVNDTRFRDGCFFFHDVDTISEDDRTLYRCKGEQTVVHLSHRIDKFDYKFCCGITVGGVLGLSSKQFQAVNGFSNAYYGWGGEDDDINARIKWTGKFGVYRQPEEYVKFKMIRHTKDLKNPKNDERISLLKNWGTRQPNDGLNSLETKITKVVNYKTHTRIFVKPKPK